MTPYQKKEANRLYYMVKGQLIPESWPDAQVEAIYDSYIHRLWGNHERETYSRSDFQRAWEERKNTKKM